MHQTPNSNPINIYNSLQKLQVNKRFKDGERFLNVGDGRSVLVLALEIIKLVFNSHVIVLSDCHFCSSFSLNVISTGLLTKNSHEISTKKVFVISF